MSGSVWNPVGWINTAFANFINFLQRCVGAVTRTVASKLEEQVSVFDFMTEEQIADVRAGTALLDVTAAVRTALATGPVKVYGGVYKITDTLTVTHNISTDGTWPEFKFVCGTTAPTTIGALLYVTGEADIVGLKITATDSSKVQYGVFIDASTRAVTRPTNYDVDISNLRNTDNTKACAGLIFYTSSGATNLKQKATIKAIVNNVVATPNGIIGDSAGAGTGIGVSINGTGSDNDIEILESVVNGVRPAEDGDGIHIYVADHNVSTAKGSYRITNCRANNNAKRGIKVQAQNCVVTAPYVDADMTDSATSASVAIDCYGQNNTVLDPVVKSSYGGDGVAGRGDNFKLINPNLRMLQPTVPIRIDSSDGFEVLGGSVYTEKNFANNDNAIVSVNAGCTGYIEAPRCVNTLSKGSVVQLQSLTASDSVVIDIPVSGTSETLVAARFCTGTFIINTAQGACSGKIVDATDCADVQIKSINASTTGIVGVSAVRSTLKMIGSGTIKGATTIGIDVNGVVVGTGRQQITGNWSVIGTGAGTSGVDITGAAKSEVIGLYTEGWTVHIRYSSSTDSFIGNNRARGAGTHLLGTAATGAITYSNNLIV